QTLRDIGRPPLLRESVFVKSNKRFNKISTSEINFIQAEGSYSRIFTKTGEYIVSYNLSQFQNEIDNRYFMRVHRSYVINLKNIEGFDLDSVFVSGKAIPVSKQYQAELFKAVKKF
ncbi:MAG: LytTR family transcriptional regulator DNA-binding domain-containing protein, partial [Bacteroidia bacterium]|nr:LytTR family transcriptional regulator DNA-binding domain-containing protein [Bacteroidia bacterium]